MIFKKWAFILLILKKNNETFKIYTTQGTRSQIKLLMPVLKKYLFRKGGIVDGKIKEERTIKWIYQPVNVELPPSIKTIKFIE